MPITSDDINDYLREAMGREFTTKDFRTWHGTVLCAAELSRVPLGGSTAERRRVVSAAMQAVSARLRNTAAVCRSCYVHPAVIDRFMLDGALVLPRAPRLLPAVERRLGPEEARVLRFLARESQRHERADLRRALRRSLRSARNR